PPCPAAASSPRCTPTATNPFPSSRRACSSCSGPVLLGVSRDKRSPRRKHSRSQRHSFRQEWPPSQAQALDFLCACSDFCVFLARVSRLWPPPSPLRSLALLAVSPHSSDILRRFMASTASIRCAEPTSTLS